MTRRRVKRAFLLVLTSFGVLLFSALGIWQVERRAWKLDLIERVDARVHAPATPLPEPGQWARLKPSDIEYRKVLATGTYRYDRETMVDALTDRGAGYWVLTPLVARSGIILVNRGFVPADQSQPGQRAASQVGGEVTVRGLLRVAEPQGRFLRANQPAADRWYSRDVVAIASARHLGPVAPFFIDADAAPNPGGLPIGGLTVIRFRNAHLVYALTWFALAVMSAVGLVIVARGEQERR